MQLTLIKQHTFWQSATLIDSFMWPGEASFCFPPKGHSAQMCTQDQKKNRERVFIFPYGTDLCGVQEKHFQLKGVPFSGQ